MVSKVALILASGLYSGYAPKAPGTVGTVVFWIGWVSACHTLHPFSPLISLLLTVLVSVIGLVTTSIAISHSGQKDPQFVVIDEWAGLACTFCFLPVESFSIPSALCALLLFRLFDISKVWPINQFEQLPGTWGVMTDDIVAGLLAGLCLQIALYSGLL